MSGHDLSAAQILGALSGTRFRHVEVHPSVPSTQGLLAAEGGRDGRVVVADHQTAGRGRQGRTWASPPGASLLFSALIDEPPSRAAAIALAAGVAVVDGISRSGGPAARLKWPNDVLLDGRKVAGILGEVCAAGVVVGIGVNVGQGASDFPEGVEATSLAIAGAAAHRGRLLAETLSAFHSLLSSDMLLARYRSLCDTVGRRVRVELPDGVLEGTATAVDESGALVVDDRRVLAGDVVHVR